MHKTTFHRILIIPAIYFILSSFYITFSDSIMLYFVDDISAYRDIQTLKGWVFILATSLIIFLLIRQLINKLEDEYNKDIEFENTIKSKNESYDKLFTNNPIPMWIYDSNSLNIIDVNDAAINLYGYSRDEFLNLNIKDIRPKEDISKLLDDVKENSATFSIPHEWRHFKRNGELIYVEIKSHSFEYKGIPSRIVMIYDITERIKLNEQLLQAKEIAEESDKLKTSILNNISHEIRTPLNGILGFSKLIASEETSKEERLEYYSFIKNSSERLTMTIDNLIELSKVESGQNKLSLSNINLIEIIDDLYVSYNSKCKEKGLELIKEYNFDKDNCTLLLDGKKIFYIFSLLLNNAIKFTDKGNIRFGITIESNFIIGYVFDTGIGIDHYFQDKIFGSFYQVESSISRPYEGGGIGLSICKAFIELMSGKIWVESKLGKGSKFFFSIPFK